MRSIMDSDCECSSPGRYIAALSELCRGRDLADIETQGSGTPANIRMEPTRQTFWQSVAAVRGSFGTLAERRPQLILAERHIGAYSG